MSEETVVGWDGSAAAQRALEWALQRAEARGEGLLIARVVAEKDVPPGNSATDSAIEEAESALDEVQHSVQMLHPRLAVRSRLLFGEPVAELQALSDENTLIVLGSDSARDSDGAGPWSVGARLAAVSYGPVAVVPADVSGGARTGIVAGVDGSAASAVAAQFAAAEAVRSGEVFTAVHAWQVPGMWDEATLDDDSLHALEEVHRGILDTLVERVRHAFPTLSVTTSLVREPALQALQEAGSNGRMLVLGNHGLNAVPRLVLGPVSHSLVRKVDVPTVIVRAAEYAL